MKMKIIKADISGHLADIITTVGFATICGQGLTRKSTAKRHNNNLHLGKAMVVRPYEYIVGRLNGTFLYNNPLYKPPSEARKAVDNVQTGET